MRYAVTAQAVIRTGIDTDDEIILASLFELRFEEMHRLDRNTLVLLTNADEDGNI